MNPFNTYFLQAAIEVIPIRHTWFRDRYFPTDEELVIARDTMRLVQAMSE